jgi:hypothetical protein
MTEWIKVSIYCGTTYVHTRLSADCIARSFLVHIRDAHSVLPLTFAPRVPPPPKAPTRCFECSAAKNVNFGDGVSTPEGSHDRLPASGLGPAVGERAATDATVPCSSAAATIRSFSILGPATAALQRRDHLNRPLSWEYHQEQSCDFTSAPASETRPSPARTRPSVGPPRCSCSDTRR